MGLDVYGLWLRLDFAAIFSQFCCWFGIKTGTANYVVAMNAVLRLGENSV